MPPNPHRQLPWSSSHPPLMLAPMQGVTNRAMRQVFAELVRPDTLFTEFVRVAGSSKTRISAADRQEIRAAGEIPLVVQLIGNQREALVSAAEQAQQAGARHLNLNLGCPYGRMTTSLTGGKLLQRPDLIEELVPALRQVIDGSFSVKLRAGYDDHQTVFRLLPLFESAGVDFLILHPRSVTQGYTGLADHRVTAEVVRQTSLPVIANGDIRTAADGMQLLVETSAAGLMLGRGAIADPWLFCRLRAGEVTQPTPAEQLQQMQRYLQQVVTAYAKLFCGEKQVMMKLKGVLTAMETPALQGRIDRLKKTKTFSEFERRLHED